MSNSSFVKQLTIFMENRRGRLAAICSALGDAGINIQALSLADTADFGIVRLIVSDPMRAMNTLREKGFTAVEHEVLALDLEDTPGSLAKVLHLLETVGVNIEYLYAFAGNQSGRATLAFRFDNPDEALRALRHAGIVKTHSKA